MQLLTAELEKKNILKNCIADDRPSIEQSIHSKERHNTVYSISEVAQIIENMFKHCSLLKSIYIHGEITGCKVHSSGRTYLTLRDASGGKAILRAIIWANNRPAFDLVDGLEIHCIGDIKPYLDGSCYNLDIKKVLSISNTGALIAQLKALEEKLSKEGLFNSVHKKRLPRIPNVIGLITARGSDGYQDVVGKQLQERFVGHVVFKSVAVQGRDCPGQVIMAIELLNNIVGPMRPDVIIITRGGGSFEDLWCFNDEGMVRAIFASKIPIITAIGHENDSPIVDLVADMRAATPTEAGIKVSMSRHDIHASIEKNCIISKNYTISRWEKCKERLYRAKLSLVGTTLFDQIDDLLRITLRKIDILIERRITFLQNSIENAAQKIEYLIRGSIHSFIAKVDAANVTLKFHSNAQRVVIVNTLARDKKRLQYCAALLDSCDFKKVLERGFALIKIDGRYISSGFKLREMMEVGGKSHADHAEGKAMNGREDKIKAVKPTLSIEMHDTTISFLVEQLCD